jgi:peptidoglycan/xylan/chitin deacetylase (PgdA/CDA1 family)
MKSFPKYQKLLYQLFFFLCIPQLARLWNRSKVMILCYHGITERAGPDPEDRSGIAVGRALFLTQLRYLNYYYRVIALRDYLAARQGDQILPPHSLILTFDDGLRNFLTVAVPILNELGLPATVFLVTDKVDARDSSIMGSKWVPLDDRISLSWPEARMLHSVYAVDFGSHTCSHPKLPQLSSSDVYRELKNSLYAIGENLNAQDPPSFAYPYGEYTESIAEKARSLGYSCASTTGAGANPLDADLFQLRRAVVRRDDTVEVFAARVSGLVGWLRIANDFISRISSL